MGRAAADVVVNPVSGRGRRGGGARLVRRDVDGVFAGQEHPTGRAGPQGGVGTQRGGVHLRTHTHRGQTYSCDATLQPLPAQCDVTSSRRARAGDRRGRTAAVYLSAKCRICLM